MNLLKRTGQWARHQWSAQGPMLLHSPYVFDFFNKVYRGGPSQHGKQVDGLRKKLTKSPTIITRQDLGAGGEQSIKLGQSVRNAGRRRVEGEWLYHLCRWAQPKRLLELGTHVGLSALYQSGGLEGDFSFLSLEGDPSFAQIARTHFQEWKRPIRIIQGNFTDSLTSPELSTYRPDYVLIDGNHRGQATITYFELLLPRMQAGGIMVFDDIRWSTDMTQAWQDIVQHPEVSVSIDLFTLGICFIRRPQAKAHFTFRYRFLP